MWFAIWMTTCAGNAARRRSAHLRVGASSSAASKIEFGGQSVETGEGWMLNAKPTRAPKKYPTHTSVAGINIDARSVGLLLIAFSRLGSQPHDVRTSVAGRSVHLKKSWRLSGLRE